MNPILKNNQRVTYLRNLPSAVVLHNYIQELDTKYNVNSKDHENSFGDITLDNPIIKNGSPKDLFEVRYDRLDSNLTFDFSTTYKSWQNQEEMPHNHPCYTFWKKWNIFHLTTLTINEWQEMHEDLQTIEKEVAKKAIHR